MCFYQITVVKHYYGLAHIFLMHIFEDSWFKVSVGGAETPGVSVQQTVSQGGGASYDWRLGLLLDMFPLPHLPVSSN